MTDSISSRSANTTTSGRPGRPRIDPDSESTLPESKKIPGEPHGIVGPIPCSVCGVHLYWYSDHVWRQFHGEPAHQCGGYYARHRAEHPDDYAPLHELKNRIPSIDPYKRPVNAGLRKGARRW